MRDIGSRGNLWLLNGGFGNGDGDTTSGLFCGDSIRFIGWKIQVKTEEVKIGRGQIIAEVEVSENWAMNKDFYDELQLAAV